MKIKLDLKSNLHIYITFALAAGLLIFTYACEPKTRSLFKPNSKVTQTQFDQEVARMTDLFLSGYDDIKKQIAFRDFVLQQSLTFTTTGTIDPIGVISSLMVLLGIGAAVDDVKVRKKLKNVNKSNATN